MKAPICGKCGSQRTNRRERQGFFQRVLLAGIGYYPWECISCWNVFYAANRGHRGRQGERRAKPPMTATPAD